MKVLIWIVFLIIFSFIQSDLHLAGITLGAIPTILYWAFFLWVVKTCCRAWDKHKKRDNQPEEAPAISEDGEVSPAQPVMTAKVATELVLCPKCGKRQMATRSKCFYCGTELNDPAELEEELKASEPIAKYDAAADILAPAVQRPTNLPNTASKDSSFLAEPTALVESDETAITQMHSTEPEITQENAEEHDDDYIYAAYCGKCGGKIVDGNRFCIYCGAEVPKVPKPRR